MDASVVGLIIGIILVIITLFLIFWGNKKKVAVAETKKSVEPVQAPAVAAVAQPPAPAQPVPVQEDDLVIIEGIGPKINTLLKQHGIKTFAQLAATDVAVLVQILAENKLQFAKPDSWPEQARLAAAGKMDELKALQDKLVAGR